MLQALCPSAGFLFRPTLHLSHLHVYLSWLLTTNTSFRNALLFTLRPGEGDQRYFLQKSSLDALNTPSHTPSSTSVYDALHGFYFAGWRLVLNLNGATAWLCMTECMLGLFYMVKTYQKQKLDRHEYRTNEWCLSLPSCACIFLPASSTHPVSFIRCLIFNWGWNL